MDPEIEEKLKPFRAAVKEQVWLIVVLYFLVKFAKYI